MGELADQSTVLKNSFLPVFFNLNFPDDKLAFDRLLEEKKPSLVDEIHHQLNELIALRFPHKMGRISSEELEEGIKKELNGSELYEYGVWVYYPWRNTAIHLLGEEAFIEVRTNRNMLKITSDEQKLLRSKIVGIIGMSVGSGAALAIAMERGAGEIRIADMDTLDLSNLNRIRSSVLNLGLPKTTIVAREIAELDPYLNVSVFDCGINEENIDDFFDDEGRIDVLVELCDSLKIKLLARKEAKKRCIPVVMETSDRGTLDVERFDLDFNAGLLHGRFTDVEVENLLVCDNWSSEISAKFMAPNELSKEMLLSLREMGKSISRWPQTGSEVTMGAGVVAAVVRKILLGDSKIHGRKFIDIDELYMD
jgi:molybdopterin/thiamine biosynthesis adenylyltransferase